MDVTTHWESGWKPEESGDYFENCSKDDIQDYYAKWAPTYDADEEENRKYFAPVTTVKEIVSLYADKTVNILDIGAGTGLVSIQLRKYGFHNVDALDGSPEMLNVAQSRGLYRKYIHTYLGAEANPLIQNASYDVLSACACFCPHHLNHTVFPEFYRITRHQGHIIIVTRREFIEDTDEFRGVFDREMERFEAEGKWNIVKREINQDYYDDIQGLVYVLKVNKI